MKRLVFDYVIVGAGSAGCALAARLSASGEHSVLLLEAGGTDDNLWIHVPLGAGKLLNNEKYTWKFETEPQGELNGRRIYSPRGKVLGGSSSINGMAHVWGDPRVFDRWVQMGNAGWSYADVEPYFKRLESNAYTLDARRGHDGPVKITDRKVRDRDALSDAFIQSCLQAGIPETGDYNVGSYEGARYLEQTAFGGMRCSTAVAYLRDARDRSNLGIETHALVAKVIFEGNCAVGVEYLHGGETRSARARKEVLLAAGAIQSPQLLELSGVGDPALLQAMGIPVVANVTAVGEHMVDHLQLRCTYETMLPITINDVVRSFWYRMRAGARYVLTRKGLLAGTSSTAHAITRSDTTLDGPDVMVRIYQISGKDRFSRAKSGGIDAYSGFSIGGFKLCPKSRGSIHIQSRDPQVHPRIEPHYFADDEDRRTAVGLLRLIRKIAMQPALQALIVAEHRPGPGVLDSAGLLDYARATGQTAWHTVGTCRMGRPDEGVVDTRLRVHGVHGLRVIDASVMPTIPSSNTNAAAIMMGERGADLILEDAEKPA
jgi:choline dehydrogenase